ncbi:DegT/DnrJ/EryC1/StrS family aminotransferase [Salinispora arenicola]|uniref:Aminotransferase DegT n=1 Tax=Salinispora arenicola TaxID=168697 RepID=A0A542XTF5_SALAC|nr:DegT/DnrJ/EryC1/StrS family aminotransferase [Salinispora arenicola]MCN0152029.1 DegT/DnrJ/EryC1/StrS family aminotransferase [Salinispora arenicola]TQL39120.1 dTDP-4-amino-4,6-dideoxygalactose transaminase [Salinispora arenicola]GIM88019.1 aminotransferase DegT [Salinispora arenicola]
MIPLSKIAMSPDVDRRISAVLHSGRLEHGPTVAEYEATVGERVGNPRVVSVNCGTAGLHLALSLAARPGPGPGQADRAEPGEVLSTPLTFEGTNWPALANGLRVRWVDVDPATLNVDLDDLAAKISPATRAIVVVHWLGYPVDLNRLCAVVDQAAARYGHRPLIIEDCAQAWGATYRGTPLGTHGNVCVFSTGAIKTLTTGSGGLVVLPDDDLHERLRLRRWLGIERASARITGDYDVAEWGYRFVLNEIGGAIGLSNLEHVDELLRRHRENAAYYDKELTGLDGVEHTERADDREPSFWVYPLKVRDRSAFMCRLRDAGIASSVISRRNDAHSCMASSRAHLPGLDSVADRVVYIPVGWWLTAEDRSHVVETIRSGW